MSIRTIRMTTEQVKNYYDSEGEDDHLSDSDYIEESASSSESEDEYDNIQYDHVDVRSDNIPNTRRQAAPKPYHTTLEITAIKNGLTKETREKKEKNKMQTKKMAKIRGYKRVRISDGMDWTCSLEPDRMRTRSENKRFQQELNIHEDMLVKLEDDGHLSRYNDNELFILRK